MKSEEHYWKQYQCDKGLKFFKSMQVFFTSLSPKYYSMFHLKGFFLMFWNEIFNGSKVIKPVSCQNWNCSAPQHSVTQLLFLASASSWGAFWWLSLLQWQKVKLCLKRTELTLMWSGPSAASFQPTSILAQLYPWTTEWLCVCLSKVAQMVRFIPWDSVCRLSLPPTMIYCEIFPCQCV